MRQGDSDGQVEEVVYHCHRGIEWFGMVWKYGKYEFTVRNLMLYLQGPSTPQPSIRRPEPGTADVPLLSFD